MNKSSDKFNPRETYKLVETLVAGKYKNQLDLLRNLVIQIVDNKNFEINGGRVWEFLPSELAYELRFQYGNVEKIPDNYRIYIEDQPFLKDLVRYRTLLKKETDELLKSKGITLYSVSGVGNIIRARGDKYYQYLLGFNAPEIKDVFRETLAIISSVATVTLRNIYESIEKRKIREDLYQASQIQRRLFPDHNLEYLDYEIFGVCIPDREVGGDYFDYLRSGRTDDERLGIIVSDASSKGLPAAIQALFVSGAIRMGWSYSVRMSDLVTQLNKLIFDTFPFERFVSLFYCELFPTNNRLLLYVNAGHNSPLLFRAESKEIIKLEPTGGLLGLIENQKFGVENVSIRPGDILVIYTDGITEAMSNEHKLFGEERLIELVLNNMEKSPQHLAYTILEEVSKFQANSEINDDKTLVIVKRKEK